MSADNVEKFIIDQIRQIGTDPQLQDETFHQAVGQVKARRRGLKLESKRIIDELTRSRAEVERLVATVSRVDGNHPCVVADQVEV